MLRSVEAIIDEAGNVRLLDDVQLEGPRRAIVTILDEPPITVTIHPSRPEDSFQTVAHWGTSYDSLRLLGRGGMGETFLARDKQSGSLVCVKQLLPEVDPRSLLQECRALARLTHPNIVRLLHFDTLSAFPFLVLEYVEGPTLSTYMRHHRIIAEPVVVRLAIGIFEAIAYAHESEILHCDLKPGNILLSASPGEEPQPKVLDFGLAVVDRRDDRDADTAEGRFAGTPSYMSPEQVRGERLGGSCDVYSAGQILWEMLTGQPAFSAQNGRWATIMFEKATQSSGLIISEPLLGVSKALSKLIEQCTHPDPERRPTAYQALDALRSIAVPTESPAVLAPMNPDFRGSASRGYPPGWFDSRGFVDGVSTEYQSSVEISPTGKSCVRFESRAAGDREFGSMMQRCQAGHLAGRRVRFEGRLRTEDIGRRAGLWLRADGAAGALSFDNMRDRPVRGSTRWASYSIEVDLPPRTSWLNYGILFVGSGRLWCENLRLSVALSSGEWLPLSLWDEEAYRTQEANAPV
jgi:serine/threonine protein kinase